MCNCKIVEICQSEYQDPGLHQDLVLDKACELCKSTSNRWSFHGEAKDCAGSSLECSECHRYIQYFDCKDCEDLDELSNDLVFKEEFYVGEFAILKEDGNFIILLFSEGYDKFVATIPEFKFSSQEHLLKKIKTYITFL
jgi:hypothetical protein